MTLSQAAKGTQAGFSLVETALALLVASIGLTAVVALIPSAMQQGKKSSDETFAAFLADSAFASFRAAADSAEADRMWANLKDYIAIPPVTISIPSDGTDVFWKDSIDLSIEADGQIHTQVFTAASTQGKWGGSWILPSDWEQYDHGLRHRLTLSNISPRLASLAMEIWPGEFGSTASPYVYYTEVFNHGY